MSNQWRCLHLGDGIMAMQSQTALVEQFQTLFEASGRPREMAIFIRHDSEASLHCEVTAFFPPATEAVARQLGARLCAAPTRNGLQLLAGGRRCWSALFDDKSDRATE